MKAVLEYWPAFLQGLWVTVWVSVCIILLGALGGVVLGALRLSKTPVIRAATTFFIECVRGPSGLVWMFWVFYALPLIPGMPQLSAVGASILVLAVGGAAYGSEIVRAGIESVHLGQSDACHALGLSKLHSFTRVVLPQALSQIVPAFGSMARDMIKWTAIVSFVGVHDVLYVADYVRSQTFQTFTVYCLVAAAYWILCLICALAFLALEQVLPLNRALRAARVSAQSAANAHALGGAAP
ncbi:amino acid ABC transporter permease [Bradyrhizobium sp. BWA-3-5]|uniref:amino acid ABC transporter permease n=1 Tax=Bradyrhizobium sp. BWA-3-5 TaxID=3080013 RepID=UPI00293ED7C7|nr:amino acid ABC transporter permease [Bradyrhizobium sp. BWA-3-5]WOH63944.1 amino acid ABC transporter permease [Bradyrhizobium sp. BWA-3-5]